jgi:hypothetical protein
MERTFLHNLPVVLIVSVLTIACTKTKTGNYKLIFEGTKYTVEKNAQCCDTTGIYSLTDYYAESLVKVVHVGNSTIEVNGQIWKKDAKSILYDYSYDSRANPGTALGGGYNYKESYEGAIESNKLIRGDYFRDEFSYAINNKTYKTIIRAKFTLKKD